MGPTNEDLILAPVPPEQADKPEHEARPRPPCPDDLAQTPALLG